MHSVLTDVTWDARSHSNYTPTRKCPLLHSEQGYVRLNSVRPAATFFLPAGSMNFVMHTLATELSQRLGHRTGVIHQHARIDYLSHARISRAWSADSGMCQLFTAPNSANVKDRAHRFAGKNVRVQSVRGIRDSDVVGPLSLL